jgi:Flp pilus assembly protein TadD
MLIEADGEIVTREEIRERLWPDDTVVEFDHSINNAIKKLRRALVDSGDEPHYIGTIAKRGYRLLVPVERIGTEDEFLESTRSPDDKLERGGTHLFVKAGGTAQSALQLQTGADSSAQMNAARPRTTSRWMLVVAVAILFGAAVAGTLYWRFHRAPKLTDRDTIVIADFDNKTGDPVFDDTLKQALTIQLQQSPFFNILSNRKIRGALSEMNRSGNELLTGDAARDVCRHTSSRAVLNGSIASFGNGYVLELRAVDCTTGDVLAEAQEQPGGKELVVSALDEAAIAIRKQMGEPLKLVQRYAAPLAEATTPSLEAWKSYSVGHQTENKEGMTAALPFFKRAAEIDSNFAMAYSALAVVYSNLNETKRSEQYAEKAYHLRSRVSQRERFVIEATYHAKTTGDLEAAAQVYQSWQQTYPKDLAPVTNLCVIYGKLGNLEKQLETSRQAKRLEPNAAVAYVDLTSTYMNLNRLNDAEDMVREAEQHKAAGEYLLQDRYQIAFLRGDTVQMEQTVAAAVGKPGMEDLLLASEADTQGWYGRVRAASKLTQRAATSAEHNDAKETAAGYWAAAALREAAVGNRLNARADAQQALELSRGRDIKAMSALALVEAGDPAAVSDLESELKRDFPLDTLVQHYWLPTIDAAVALEQGDAKRAVELLKQTSALELSGPSLANVLLCPVYFHGEAYLMLRDGKAAAAEFQKFIDHYGLITNFPWGALARLGVARAYALEAETDSAYREKARTAYQNFLSLWKDADPDVPIYKEAKAEYAKRQ